MRLMPVIRILVKDSHVASTADDDLAIRTLFERWYRAMEDGNVAELISLVTADVIVKAPGSPPILGSDALKQALTAFLESHTETVDYDVAEVEVSGQLAFARVSERATIQPKSGPQASVIDGMHLAILKRQPDGEWLLARYVSSLIDPT